MSGSLKRLEHWAIRIVCAVAVVLVGLAHRPPDLARAEGLPADYVRYTLPDGSLPTLCITTTDADGTRDGGHHDGHRDRGCEACRLGATSLLPEPAVVADTLFRTYEPVELPLEAQTEHHPSLPPNTGPRAPPYILIGV